MQDTPFVVAVTQHNFSAVVVENSQRVPVLVDFWADWCQPCKTLTPILTQLAQSYNGGVLLATVNADSEQALAGHFQVRSIPTVLLVWQGQIIEQWVGVQPESVYRAALDPLFIQPSDIAIEQAEILWQNGHQEEAIALLDEGLQQQPDHAGLKTALADKLLQCDRGEEARLLLQSLPTDAQRLQPASGLLARLQFADQAIGTPDIDTLEQCVKVTPNDDIARCQLATRYVLAGRTEEAIVQLLDVLRRNPQFEDGAAKKGLIAIFELLGNENPLAIRYRRQMFSLLH